MGGTGEGTERTKWRGQERNGGNKMEGTGRKRREREGRGERSGGDRGRKWREQRGENGRSVRGQRGPERPRRTKTTERKRAGNLSQERGVIWRREGVPPSGEQQQVFLEADGQRQLLHGLGQEAQAKRAAQDRKSVV